MQGEEILEHRDFQTFFPSRLPLGVTEVHDNDG